MSEPCNRFEEVALMQLQRGEALDGHFSTCPECATAQQQYERLAGALGAIPAGRGPRGDWQARVWALVERERALRRRRKLIVAGVAPALAAALALVVIRGGLPAGDRPFRLEVAVREAPGTVRGSVAKPGDTLELTAELGRSAHAELRVYRDDRELLWRCPPLNAGCVVESGGRELKGRAALPSPGMYQAVLIGSDVDLPPPSGDLAADSAAALRGGARVELAVPVQVF